VKGKLSPDQAAAYQQFAALLADFDGADMVQLLEAALADAQMLTGLGDFYAAAEAEAQDAQPTSATEDGTAA
jgi:hypothetical protein